MTGFTRYFKGNLCKPLAGVLLILFNCFSYQLYAQNTLVPDPNLEQALIDLGIDSDGVLDGDFPTADANEVTELNLVNRGISDLTGIAAFSNLEQLNCANNNLEAVDLSQNTALVRLNISSNLLNNLDVSSHTALEILNVQANALSALDLSANTSLVDLDMTLNDLTSIDLSANTNLVKLKCANNQLQNLDISSNGLLQDLICSNNQLISLDVSNNPDLITLFSSSNQLSVLDIDSNTELLLLDVSDNQLTSLDVSQNRLLEQLTCSANQLTALNVMQNDSLRSLRISNNQISTLDLSAATKLETFAAASNLLSTIDLSFTDVLTTFNVATNLFTSIDLSAQTMLVSVDVSDNLLGYLTIQNGNNELLSSFNATNNASLSCIQIDDPGVVNASWLKDAGTSYALNCDPLLTIIPDANFEQALIDLGLDNGTPDGTIPTDAINGITSLDISNLNISDLGGIQDFVSLEVLNCSINQLTNIDLTQNGRLVNINASDNSLVGLNLRNGNNAAIIDLDVRTNPALTCVTVDDPAAVQPGWLDDGVTYAVNCNAGSTFIPDDHFEQALIDLGIDTGPLDNYVLTTALSGVTDLDISDKQIENLTGIEAFSALEILDCSNNLLFELDITQNTNLSDLAAYNNYLTQLDLAANPGLISLNVGNNRLSQLDLLANTLLEELIVDSNFLSDIDISTNTQLRTLNANSNNFTSVGFDITSLSNLEDLLCANNLLTSIDVSQNPLLSALDFSNNRVAVIDLSQNSGLRKLNCSSNLISTLDLTNNILLDTLEANSNNLNNLSLTTNTLLELVSVENNNIATLGITSNSELKSLLVSSNNLNTLDITNNNAMVFLQADDNNLLSLDLTNAADLLSLSVNNNNLITLDLTNNTLVTRVSCNGNQLDALDVSSNPDLLELLVNGNELTDLNLASNINLVNLSVSDNNLNTLDLNNNQQLEVVDVSENNIEVLDLSTQMDLRSLSCPSNNLTALSINNGNNGNLEVLNAINNPNLMCIEVDDPNSTGDNWQKDAAATYSTNCRYADTFVPDDNFESVLAQITGEPDNNDDYISTSSIASITTLDVGASVISDLTGLQDIELLQTLNVSDNNLDTLILTGLNDLIEVNASNNNLTGIDFSGLSKLEVLNLDNNEVSELELGALPQLSVLSCVGNTLEALELSGNVNLTSIFCSSNNLELLNIQNGNNPVLTNMDASGNPNLNCIQVDDPSATGSAWLKDDVTSYSTDCHFGETFVPDDAFEQALIQLGFDETSTGPLDDYVPTEKLERATSLSVVNRGITDITGIEAFINLQLLNASNNELSTINLSQVQNLVTLNLSGNQLEIIDVSELVNLATLNVSANKLSSLDVTQNRELITLQFSSNQIGAVDLRQNLELKVINGQTNALISVDLNNGANSEITSLDLQNNPNLTCILVDDVNAAIGYTGWLKDEQSVYKLICDDDDNDGVKDEEDRCPATPFGSQVDLFGCAIFSLPTDNFTVKVTSESCRGGNNGKINIIASEILNYTATLISELDSVNTYNFGDRVEIRNVRAGLYSLCIRVENQPEYEQCYSLLIEQPKDLNVFETGRKNGRVSFQLNGSEVYEISINGRTFATSDSAISLSLKKGRNTIRIKGKEDCQGIFEAEYYKVDQETVFPNPFNNELSIALPEVENSIVQVNVFTLSGSLLIQQQFQDTKGLVQINSTDLPSGIYYVEVHAGNEVSQFKVMKR